MYNPNRRVLKRWDVGIFRDGCFFSVVDDNIMAAVVVVNCEIGLVVEREVVSLSTGPVSISWNKIVFEESVIVDK